MPKKKEKILLLKNTLLVFQKISFKANVLKHKCTSVATYYGLYNYDIILELVRSINEIAEIMNLPRTYAVGPENSSDIYFLISFIDNKNIMISMKEDEFDEYYGIENAIKLSKKINKLSYIFDNIVKKIDLQIQIIKKFLENEKRI